MNFSFIFSGVNSFKGDETEIVNAEPGIKEESILGYQDDDEITEDHYYVKAENNIKDEGEELKMGGRDCLVNHAKKEED